MGTELAMNLSEAKLVATRRPWTAAELSALRARYLTDSGAVLAREFGRTRDALWKKAEVLGLKKLGRWSSTDDRRLWSLWGETPLEIIASLMGRTAIVVYEHARKIGLRCGAPQGFEYLSAAARRVGFTREQLRPILQWAGVRLRRTMSKPGSRLRSSMVMPCEVDAAVAEWHRTETIESARRRLGIAHPTLRRWLIEAKANGDQSVPERPGVRRAHWHVPSTVIDKVAGERLPRFGKKRAA